MIRAKTLEVCVVDHCNLRCQHCSHFSPYFKTKRFYDIRRFQRDIDALATVYRPRIVRLIGGEPLLHPEVGGFARYLKTRGLCERVDLITNGLLLPSVNLDFLEFVDRVQVSVYASVKADYVRLLEKFQEKLARFRLRWEVRHASEVHARELSSAEERRYQTFQEALLKIAVGSVRKIDGELTGEKVVSDGRPTLIVSVKFEDKFRVLTPDAALDDAGMAATYAKCGMKTTCHQLHNGMFYKCPRPQNLIAFTEAGYGAEEQAADGVELHAPDLPSRFRDYYSATTPLAACAWCLEGLEPARFEKHTQTPYAQT